MMELEPTSPGEILQEEFLEPMNVTAYRLAKEVHIPQSRISDIISGKRGITADTAMRFAMYFGTTTQFWFCYIRKSLYDSAWAWTYRYP